MVNLSKFTSNKKILSKVIDLSNSQFCRTLSLFFSSFTHFAGFVFFSLNINLVVSLQPNTNRGNQHNIAGNHQSQENTKTKHSQQSSKKSEHKNKNENKEGISWVLLFHFSSCGIYILVHNTHTITEPQYTHSSISIKRKYNKLIVYVFKIFLNLLKKNFKKKTHFLLIK